MIPSVVKIASISYPTIVGYEIEAIDLSWDQLINHSPPRSHQKNMINYLT
jgi:hypothetical protein